MEYLKDWVDYGTLGILGLMSVLAIGFAIERAFFYTQGLRKQRAAQQSVEYY